MRPLIHLFNAHPASVNETYGQHLVTAWSFGLRLLAAGFACLAHGLLPFLFPATASTAVRELHARMVDHRRRADR